MNASSSDSSVLPTPTFFYGLHRSDEIAVDIERGKTLIIRFLAVGDADHVFSSQSVSQPLGVAHVCL